ncbi:MAG: F0F1 ATP synthase subunit gamma [Methylobacter sp.]|nr:F0F1 ATP synthase subunit gamma [Methylobacter sp.]MDP2430144.1 F0F1 ATP synthase subunit gamma [Methylobacter sp.]MDP3054285.1 F0F1 ATP synthase subunit gamma [Methylobacter sp.]MDP3363747.1 F0F1 ATP synthase subunit gamma [Methylobacter sp.]MDZ4220835.1 F0F1 ATP synthase subunit gamma [Methylobacter sp.]
MQTLESLQRDMDTAGDLQSIVRTMKVLAAVSIRQYERALEALVDYQLTVDLGLQVVLKGRSMPPSKKQSPVTGVIVLGSDHGLCGRYNESIAAFALAALECDPLQRRILVVGARVEAALKAMGQDVEALFLVPGSVAGITQTVRQLLLHIDSWQQQGIERVLLFHNSHQQRTAYSPQMRPLLPIDFDNFSQLKAKPWPSNALPQFSQDSETLLSSLIRQHLFIQLFSACAESLAGEHASRLVSMQVAEKNIKERLETLTAAHRLQRQNQITEELLDVVAGFEALNEDKKGGSDAYVTTKKHTECLEEWR